MGRFLGPSVRAAPRPGRRPGRSLRTPLIDETVELAGRKLTIRRPPSADALIDEEAFADDEFLPYWAELWTSGVALARVVAGLDLTGKRVVELGAGLGLPSLAAALAGADLLAGAPWDVVLGADLLYERRNADQLLELLPRLGGEILLAEPGRPFAASFLERWDAEPVADRVYRLR